MASTRPRSCAGGASHAEAKAGGNWRCMARLRAAARAGQPRAGCQGEPTSLGATECSRSKWTLAGSIGSIGVTRPRAKGTLWERWT